MTNLTCIECNFFHRLTKKCSFLNPLESCIYIKNRDAYTDIVDGKYWKNKSDSTEGDE